MKDRHFHYRDAVEIDTTRLRLDGYYYTDDRVTSGIVGSVISPYLLWADGTFASSAYSYFKEIRVEDGIAYVGTIEEARERYESSLAEDGIGYVNWGGFRIEGDSLFIQVLINYPVYLMRTGEYRGEILNDTTFVIHQVKVWGRDGYDEWIDEGYRYHFAPLPDSVKPDSSNWLHERYRRTTADD